MCFSYLFVCWSSRNSDYFLNLKADIFFSFNFYEKKKKPLIFPLHCFYFEAENSNSLIKSHISRVYQGSLEEVDSTFRKKRYRLLSTVWLFNLNNCVSISFSYGMSFWVLHSFDFWSRHLKKKDALLLEKVILIQM